MRRFLSVMAILCLGIIGCGGGGPVLVQGKLLKSGQSCSADSNDQVMIIFNEDDPKNPLPKSFPTNVDAAGNFIVKGPEKKGIPPGKYRVSASSYFLIPPTPPPQPKTPAKGAKTPPPPEPAPGDKFKGAFTPENTPWIVEVSSSNSRFTFDIDKLP